MKVVPPCQAGATLLSVPWATFATGSEPRASVINVSSRAQAVLLGGTFSGVMSALPYIAVANCCCLWLISGGIVTAYLMQQGQPQPLEVGEGAVGGALAGVVGAFVYAVVSLPIQLFLAPLQPDVADLLPPSGDLPPEVFDMVEQMVINPLLLVMLGFAVMLVVGTIFAAVGGVLGTLFYRKPAPPAPPTSGDIVPPPPGL